MNKSPESGFSNHNSDRDIGIPCVDASNKVYKMLVDAERNAKKAEENSAIDSLTGCYNGKYFEKFINENFNPNRDHNRIGLAYFDNNSLKATNDAHGHQAGDELIKYTANFLKAIFRKGDIVVRIGGDEWLVICYKNEKDDNFEDNLNSRIEGKIKNPPLDLPFGNPPLDIAFGVAIFDRDLDRNPNGYCDLGATVKRADGQMYIRKEEMKSAR